jgi:hypothetical protein
MSIHANNLTPHIVDELIEFLTILNENISWKEVLAVFLEKNLDLLTILKRIRSLLWNDQDIDDYTAEWVENIIYYKKLLHNVKELKILNINPTTTLIPQLVLKIQKRLLVAEAVCKYYNIKYSFIDSSNEQDLILMTASVTYDNKFINIKYIDSYNNICKNNDDEEINRLKLLILSVEVSADFSVILSQRFGMIFTK